MLSSSRELPSESINKGRSLMQSKYGWLLLNTASAMDGSLCSRMELGGRLGYFHSSGGFGSLLPLLVSFCSLFLFVHDMERDYLKCSGRTLPVTYCRF